MNNKYDELREKQQKEFNKFPIQFAFSDKQFKESMQKLGLTPEDVDKVIAIGNGGFIRKSDVKKFDEMMKRHLEEREEAIKKDKTGEGYIKDMFYSELNNHEYSYTKNLEDTLDAIGITLEEINKNDKLRNGLSLAIKEIKEKEELLEYE